MLLFEISADDRLALLGCVSAIAMTLLVLHWSEWLGAWWHGSSADLTAEPGLFHTSHCSDEAAELGVCPASPPTVPYERAA